MFPPIEPFASGMLAVDDGNEIYWETCGNPNGRPALYLHGGPGGGMRTGYRRLFDPVRYLVIGLDQRGCGRSRPLVTDDLTSLQANTTAHLLADIEALRVHLGIEQWLMYGVSWGSALGLAYAQAFPDRVSELLLAAVALTTPSYVEWITETVGRLYPQEWEAFERASQRRPGERAVDAYVRLLADPDVSVRAQAALDWATWEDAHVSLDPNRGPGTSYPDPVKHAVYATLVTHYWKHAAFMSADALFDGMATIQHLPGVITHGLFDVSGPVDDAWRLHKLWPASRFELVRDEGHGGPKMMEIMSRAASEFAAAG